MKELYYQIYFKERDDGLPLTTVCFRIPEENVREFAKELRASFDAGYDADVVKSRDQWAKDVLDDMAAKYDGIWTYSVVNGALIVK